MSNCGDLVSSVPALHWVQLRLAAPCKAAEVHVVSEYVRSLPDSAYTLRGIVARSAWDVDLLVTRQALEGFRLVGRCAVIPHHSQAVTPQSERAPMQCRYWLDEMDQFHV